MKLFWDDLDAADWDRHHAAASAPLQQDWAYGSCMKAIGVTCVRVRVEAEGRTVALAQFIGRRLAGMVSVALCSRGPVWTEPLTAADKAEVYRQLRSGLPVLRPRFAFFTPEEGVDDALGLSPWRRVMTGYSTVTLNLRQTREQLRAAFEGKWRNRLVAAESAGLTVQRLGANPAQFRWLLEQEDTMREQRGVAGLPSGFIERYIQARKSAAQTVLTLRADHAGERVAAMMFLLHGTAATYQVGWSNDTGRQLNAHNLLLWQAIEALQQRGVRLLDLGGVNTQRSAGIARFKLGTGGRVLTLAGTYL
jgi:lipid II:glycine glycyltransferase (peptidoglycan interpeptide bridge formation enzyme)